MPNTGATASPWHTLECAGPRKQRGQSKTAKPLSLAPSKEHLSPYLTLGFLIDAETSVGETHIVTIHSHSTSMTDTHSHSTSMTDTYTCS